MTKIFSSLICYHSQTHKPLPSKIFSLNLYRRVTIIYGAHRRRPRLLPSHLSVIWLWPYPSPVTQSLADIPRCQTSSSMLGSTYSVNLIVIADIHGSKDVIDLWHVWDLIYWRPPRSLQSDHRHIHPLDLRHVRIVLDEFLVNKREEILLINIQYSQNYQLI